MKVTLDSLDRTPRESGATVLTGRQVDAAFVRELNPDLLLWAAGAVQNIPEILGLQDRYSLTSIEVFKGENEIRGPRVLIIGAGRTGLEIAEKLGRDGYDVVATERTDPIGSMMEMITRNLTLKRIGEMKNVILMPHTAVKAFMEKSVDIEQDGGRMSLEPFDTVILASGMHSAAGPDEEIRKLAPRIEVIGDALDVLHAIGYVDRYIVEKPEEFLEYSDWMGIPIQAYPASLDRFKSLLLEQAYKLQSR